VRGVGYAQVGGNIYKNPATIVAPEMVRPYAVGHVKVEVAVAIVVEPRCASINPNARQVPYRMGNVTQTQEGHVGK
jgi:hypothetical protein